MRSRGRARGALAVLTLLAFPGVAAADGGGPVLIFAGPVVFLLGQVWIIAAELVVLRVLRRPASWGETWSDVVIANLRSYLYVGVGLPVVVSVVGLVLGFAAGGLLRLFGLDTFGNTFEHSVMGLSGWAYNNATVGKVLPFGLALWFVVTFFLSVIVEGKTLRRRWEERGAAAAPSPQYVSWLMNAVSYVGLTIVLVWSWWQEFGPQ